jgi:hypothetical protein
MGRGWREREMRNVRDGWNGAERDGAERGLTLVEEPIRRLWNMLLLASAMDILDNRERLKGWDLQEAWSTGGI